MGTLEDHARERIFAIEESVHREVVESLKTKPDKINAEALAPIVEEVLNAYLARTSVIMTSQTRREIVADVMDEVLGYGPIQKLLDDDGITEIMVNGPRNIYVERRGKIEKSDKQFRNDGHVLRIIEKIVAPLGRRIDESSPMVDARLPDGSRVNAIIPPLSLSGPLITIRKFSRTPYTSEDLLKMGTLSEDMLEFLECCVKARLNILVSGGTGSGKTTTLNVLSALIPTDERIITIEDAAELQLQQDHVITLESRPPNLEGKGEITIRQLVRNALRMRPNRIVVGEVRGGESLDMLQAMNTGHDGSLTTAHTNSPRDAISRLETMVLMAGADLPVRAIREQIASAINIIVHQNRFRDGTRKITHITEIQGLEHEQVILEDIFLFKQEGIADNGTVLGRHVFSGLRPKCMERFKQYGIEYTLPAA
ncbi:CpaF family protein [bacterium]|nr:CpaF family protein [bacterium]